MAATGWLNDEPTDSEDGQDETPKPYQDAEVTAQLAQEGLPHWFGVRWREIALEDQAQAWTWLRRWVDWFTVEYHVSEVTVPACWFQHTDTTAELYAAMCTEQKVWEAEAPTVMTVMNWQSQLPGIYQRLRDCSHNLCSGGHRPIDRQQYLRSVDEDAWAEVVAGRQATTTFQRPGQGRRYVRAVLEDAEGETLGCSKPVGIDSRSSDAEPAAELAFTAAPGQEDEQLHLSIQRADRVAELRWEESTDQQQSWRSVEEL